jgi:hypothetical protein
MQKITHAQARHRNARAAVTLNRNDRQSVVIILMKQLLLVTEMYGRTWDPGKRMNGQAQWPEHAAFMNRRDADGFVVFRWPARRK